MSDAGQSVLSRRTEERWERMLHWLKSLPCPWSPRPRKQLRLCETLPLGERRFLSLVELGRQRFLVGGTGSSLSLLAVLEPAPQPSGEPSLPEGSAVWEFVKEAHSETWVGAKPESS